MFVKNKKLISTIIVSAILLFVVGGSVLAYGSATAPDGNGGFYNAAAPAASVDANGSLYDATKPDDSSSNSTQSAIANVIGWIFFYIASFFSWLVSLMVQLMVLVASYNHFLDTKIVTNGWIIVRDIANNFFIIILLVIAVGTILKVPNYNRQLLPKLLIMAILINFSKMFTGILIDFSQVITLWFANSIVQIGNQGNILLFALGLSDLYAIDPSNYKWTQDVPFIEDGDIIKTMLFAVILSVVAVVVISMITIMLVYRIVALWFLVILSPLAYLLSTFPKGQQYAGMWWGSLTSNLVVGPVMLFFLHLSFFSGAVNVENPSANPSGQSGTLDVQEVVSAQNPEGTNQVDRTAGKIPADGTKISLGLTKKQSPAGLFDFMIIIGLMVGSLVAGQQTGAAGSQWASKGVGTLSKWGKKATVGSALGVAGLGRSAARRADGRLGLSKKAYGLGAGRVPLLRGALGKRISGLGEETTKLETGRIATASAGLAGKNTDQLMKLSENRGAGNRYNRIAAAQKLAEKGELKDDKDLTPTQRKRRIDIINGARKDLAGTPELQGVLDDNIRKNAPALSLASDMYKGKDGLYKMDKIAKDVQAGKLNAGSALSGIGATDLQAIKTATGGQDDSIAKFLMKNIDDKKVLASTFKDLKGDNREKVLDGVNRQTFIKDDGSGKLDDEKRADFLKAADHANVTKVFDKHDADDREKYNKHYEANKSDIHKNVSSKEAQQLANDMSHIMGQKDIDDLKAKGKEFKEAVTKGLEAAINEISFNDYSSPDKRKEIKKKYENGLLGGAEFDMTDGQNIDHEILGEALGGKNKKAMLEKMNVKNINSDFLRASAKQLKSSDYQTIAGVDAGNKKALKSAFASTINDTDASTTDGREMTRRLMTHATSVGADIGYSGASAADKQDVFENEVAEKLSASNLRDGKFDNSTAQVSAVAANGDINAIKSFFRDPGDNIGFAQNLATEITRIGGPRASKLAAYLP
jgi:hypothetical protein